MGRDTDFNFGANTGDGSIADDLPPCRDYIMCPGCGKTVGYCDEVPTASELQQLREVVEMIHRTRSNDAGTTGGNRGGSRRRGQGLPFLTVEQLTTTKKPGVLLQARVEADNFRNGQDMVACKIMFNNTLYLLNLRDGNPNLDALCDALGEDESTWNKVDVLFYKEIDDFNAKEWMRIEVVPKDEKKRK